MRTLTFSIAILLAVVPVMTYGQNQDQSDVRLNVRQLELLEGTERRDVGCLPPLAGKRNVALAVVEVTGSPFFGSFAGNRGTVRVPAEFQTAVVQLIAKHLPGWRVVDAFADADVNLSITLYAVEQPPGNELYLIDTFIYVRDASIAPVDCSVWSDRRYTPDVPAVLDQLLVRVAAGSAASP